MERAREYHKNVYLCVIDYSKAFDSAEPLRMWNSMRNMVVRNEYTEQQAEVQVNKAQQNGSRSKKGVCYS
jgi:hypothetical protein